MNLLLDLAFRLRRRLIGLLRLRTRGVKVMLLNEAGELLLIRNNYGRTDHFVLPGGGIGRRETPEMAARREIREELGVEVEALELLSVHASEAEGKRDTIHLFRGRAAGFPEADGFEVAESCYFALSDLPAALSAATLRRIEELVGARVADGSW